LQLRAHCRSRYVCAIANNNVFASPQISCQGISNAEASPGTPSEHWGIDKHCPRQP
jgi:hypothetical protein